ncbi:MAG: hypothetical protein JSW54_00825 [Fidelibacterota bacterium]|nr:MAG: hypothetical protein JSW54_00825 [Candidatus Neomarinimicrobiota bacterium]
MVDGGDLFFPKARLGDEIIEKEKIKARAMLAGFNQIGADAVNVGDNDLAAGLPFLKELADSAHFPLLSATLVDGEGNLLFKPYTVVERGGVRIGLIGASSEVESEGSYQSLAFLPTVGRVAEEVASQADILILLFHGSDEDKKTLVASGLPIDLILQSHVKRYDPDFGQGAIPASALGRQGKYINMITATIRSPEQPLVDLTIPRRTLKFVEKSRKRLRRNRDQETPLEELYAESPRILERIKDLEQREAEAQGIIAKAVNTIDSERIALGNKVEDDEAVLALVNAAKRAMEKVTVSAGEGENGQKQSRPGRLAAQ